MQSIINECLQAFAAELTPSYTDRNCLFGVTFVFSVLGIALGVVLPPLIAPSSPQVRDIGWRSAAGESTG